MAGPGTVPARIRGADGTRSHARPLWPGRPSQRKYSMLRKLLIAAGMSYLYRRFAGGRRGSRGAAPRW
jgi:hypothetical protein